MGLASFVSSSSNLAAENAAAGFKIKGYTITYVSMNDNIIAVFGLWDSPRPEAVHLIHRLLDQDFTVFMISGDNQATVNRIAEHVGIPLACAIGERQPDEKLREIKKLQEKGHVVLFVGDGTNDAPVLAQSNLGIAMGSATGISFESSDVILLSNDLKGVHTLIELSHNVFNRIKLNFLWAAIYNAIAIPFAAGVFSVWNQKIRIPPALAGLGEIVSVMPVLVVALLLQRFKPNF